MAGQGCAGTPISVHKWGVSGQNWSPAQLAWPFLPSVFSNTKWVASRGGGTGAHQGCGHWACRSHYGPAQSRAGPAFRRGSLQHWGPNRSGIPCRQPPGLPGQQPHWAPTWQGNQSSPPHASGANCHPSPGCDGSQGGQEKIPRNVRNPSPELMVCNMPRGWGVGACTVYGGSCCPYVQTGAGELLALRLWVPHLRPPRGWVPPVLQGPQQERAQEEAELGGGDGVRISSLPSQELSFLKDTSRASEAPPPALTVSPINSEHWEQLLSPRCQPSPSPSPRAVMPCPVHRATWLGLQSMLLPLHHTALGRAGKGWKRVFPAPPVLRWGHKGAGGGQLSRQRL